MVLGDIVKKNEIKEINGFWPSFKGLMGQKKLNYGIRLRCNGIHTFFMKIPIDVVLTDKNNNILQIIYNLKPWKIVLPKKNVYYTYEFPINIINFKIGGKIKVSVIQDKH